jgi:hypothetical protein
MSEDASRLRLEAIMTGLSQTPQRWEYRTILTIRPEGIEQLEETLRDLEARLNELGQDGWEIADLQWQVPAGDQDACIVILRRGTWHSGHVVASTNITQEFVIHKLDQMLNALNEIRDGLGSE